MHASSLQQLVNKQHMKHMNKYLGGLASVALLQLAGSSALALPSGSFDKLVEVAGYSTYPGGEFTLSFDATPLDTTYYDPSTKNQFDSPSFQTFCIEHLEYTTQQGLYQVNTKAVMGGNPPNGDVISAGTAWLYSQFASKNLGDYDYTPGSGREVDAGILQNAIWYLEGEISLAVPANNKFLADLVSEGGFSSIASAKATDNADGGYGVWVVNITTKASALGQDQLYYNKGLDIPDGGLTVMLLGLGLTGLSLIRRKIA